MEIFIKVLKIIFYYIFGIITAVLLCGGSLFTIVGLYGMFDVLSKDYPDIYGFTMVILIGLVSFRVGWLFFNKIIIEKYSNKKFEG